MSEYCDSIERVLQNCPLIDTGTANEFLSELARLRAVEEAWKAVREVFTSDDDGFDLDALRDELQRQIARLDQMKGEVKA